MKKLKGFKGKYFSLAAILALNTTIAIASEGQSVVDNVAQLQSPKAEATSETTEQLEESAAPVVVISKKIKQQKSEVYSTSKSLVSATNVTDNVTIITSEELSQKGITTVVEALNTIPGVSFVSNGGRMGTTTGVYLQGMSNKYTLLMVDGVRYNDPSNISGADFSHLLIGDIERIEVIKGAQSGVWGADAAAGVINIITKKAQNGTHASAAVELGSYGRRDVSTSVSHKTDKFDVQLSVQRVTEDGYTTLAPYGKDIDQYERDPYRNTTVNLKAGYWLDDHNRVETGYHDINTLSSYDDSLPDDAAHGDFQQRSGFVAYKYFVGNHALETTLSESTFIKKELDTTWGLSDYKGKVPSIELKDTWKYYDNSSLVMGTSYEKRELNYTEVGGTEKERDENSKALYANNTNRIGNVVLTEALRYDDFSAFDDKVTGKVGAKYLFNDKFNVYANYGTAYKTPSMLDMINPWGSSNFDLKPENIQSFNTGMQYAGFTVNFFKNDIQDKIIYRSGKNVNIDGTSVFRGIELSYEQQVLQSLLMGANYTYVDAVDKDGKRLADIPRYQTTLYTTYMPIKQIAWNLNGTYIGSRSDMYYNPNPPYDSSLKETGRYLVANTKVTYFIDKTWDVYFKVNNLFDRYYQTVYGYATAERSYYVGVEAKF